MSFGFSKRTRSSFTSLTSDTANTATRKHFLSSIPFDDINRVLGVNKRLPPSQVMGRVKIQELSEWSLKINTKINWLEKQCRKYKNMIGKSENHNQNRKSSKNKDHEINIRETNNAFKLNLYSKDLNTLKQYDSRIRDLIEELMHESDSDSASESESKTSNCNSRSYTSRLSKSTDKGCKYKKNQNVQSKTRKEKHRHSTSYSSKNRRQRETRGTKEQLEISSFCHLLIYIPKTIHIDCKLFQVFLEISNFFFCIYLFKKTYVLVGLAQVEGEVIAMAIDMVVTVVLIAKTAGMWQVSAENMAEILMGEKKNTINDTDIKMEEIKKGCMIMIVMEIIVVQVAVVVIGRSQSIGHCCHRYHHQVRKNVEREREKIRIKVNQDLDPSSEAGAGAELVAPVVAPVVAPAVAPAVAAVAPIVAKVAAKVVAKVVVTVVVTTAAVETVVAKQGAKVGAKVIVAEANQEISVHVIVNKKMKMDMYQWKAESLKLVQI